MPLMPLPSFSDSFESLESLEICSTDGHDRCAPTAPQGAATDELCASAVTPPHSLHHCWVVLFGCDSNHRRAVLFGIRSIPAESCASAPTSIAAEVRARRLRLQSSPRRLSASTHHRFAVLFGFVANCT